MREKRMEKFNILYSASVLSVFFYLLINPETASEPVLAGIYFCVGSVAPSLFLFMVLSRMITAMPFTEKFCFRLGAFGYESVILLLGTACGFPVGAKSALLLYERGAISKKRAEYICAFSNNASVSFLTGFVGVNLFSDFSAGLRLCAFQFAGSVVGALILGFVFMEKKDFARGGIKTAPAVRVSLTDAVSDSAYTIFGVCALIITFMAAGEILLSVFRLPETAGTVLRGLLEFSSGCSYASGLGVNKAFILSAVFTGFSGLCVYSQIAASVKGKLSLKMFLTGKLICAAVMGALAVLFPAAA